MNTTFNILLPSLPYIARFAKIFTLILEGIIKKFRLNVVTMSR